MTKLLSILIVGLATLAYAGPALARLASSLVPLVLVVGGVVVVLRLVWFHTRRW